MNKEKFELYVRVQKTGITNMWDVNKVIEIANDIIVQDELSIDALTKEDCLDIMENYSEYIEKFGVKE